MRKTGSECGEEGGVMTVFSIGAVQGVATPFIQQRLLSFAERRRHEGFRVTGVVQVPSESGADKNEAVVLLDLSSGRTFRVFQVLGQEAAGCTVDPSGIAEACGAVMEAISAGADIVILSKFGKLEESGSGLLHAFGAAAEAGIPCLTGVAPAYAASFVGFAADFARWLDASEAALEAWWAFSLGLSYPDSAEVKQS
jgi:hypothetical protein